jgi:hypothetical protein
MVRDVLGGQVAKVKRALVGFPQAFHVVIRPKGRRVVGLHSA